MTNTALELVVAHLRNKLTGGDSLVHAFAEWLDVFDLGQEGMGPTAGLWTPRDVAAAGFRTGGTRPTARPFADGLEWLRSREFFRPHFPQVFEADPLAILGVSIGIGSLDDSEARRWIGDIATLAASGETDSWRLALLDAATAVFVREPELSVALAAKGRGIVTQATLTAASNSSCIVDDPSAERAAVRLAVLTRASRGLPSPASAPTLETPSICRFQECPMKVLFIAANPKTTERIQLDEEIRAIKEKTRLAEHRDRIEILARWAVRPDDLHLALLETKPTVVHFSGHGAGTPGILLHGDVAGTHYLVNGDALRHLFATLKCNIRVVVFNTCDSADQAAAVSDTIDFVIGMSDAIDDESARRFATSFYLGLASGVSVGTSFDLGISSVKLHGLPGDNVPRLLVRPGVSRDDILI